MKTVTSHGRGDQDLGPGPSLGSGSGWRCQLREHPRTTRTSERQLTAHHPHQHQGSDKLAWLTNEIGTRTHYSTSLSITPEKNHNW